MNMKPNGKSWIKLVFITFFIFGLVAARADLTWSVNGAGGSGTWDATTADWWNGSQNVPWQQSGNALFSGSGGTVTASFLTVAASGMTFNSPGYTLSGGWIDSGSNGLTVTTNADATISTTLGSNGSGGNLLIKSGTGTLSMAGTNFLNAVEVNQGEYRVTGNGSLFFSTVTLAPSTYLTLAQTFSSTAIGSLNGSGIVQSDTSARTVTLSLFNAGNFSGTLQDNGAGRLAVTISTYGAQTLTGVNSYSGATDLSLGALVFSGNGSAINSTFLIANNAALVLDNSNGANANRISASAPVTMQGGTFSMIGNASSFVNEIVGALNFAGSALVNVQRSGATGAALTVSGITRAGHATLNFTGNGQLLGTGLANDSTGIAPVYARAGNDWASIDANHSVTSFAAYAPDPNTATATSNVKLTSPFTISGTAAWASVNLQNNSGAVMTMLNNGALNLASGGIVSTGSAGAIINSNLTTPASEMVVVNDNALAISGQIQESSPEMALTKTGAGALTLTSPSNSYSGTTTINQGTLIIGNDLALGSSPTIDFGGGTLKASGNFTLTQNLTSSTSYGETIDTGGFTVTATGSNSSLSKIGAGTLVLTNSSVGSVNVNQGILQLTKPTSGFATIMGGDLVASGTLSSLSFSGTTGILDIGGAAAATLSASYNHSSGNLTIDFGIGSAGSDLWKLSSGGASFGPGAFQFEFQNLGGAATGTNYTLLSFPTSVAPAPAAFGFAPDMAAAGWSGTFVTSGTNVSVDFSSIGVPEPSVSTLLVIGITALLARIRRKPVAVDP